MERTAVPNEPNRPKMFLGRVYKIYCNDCDLVYVGSTRKYLHQRLAQHKLDMRKWLKNKHNYCTSFQVIANDDCKIELLHEEIYGDEEEMHEMEKHFIHLLGAVNGRNPIVSREKLQQRRLKLLQREN